MGWDEGGRAKLGGGQGQDAEVQGGQKDEHG